MPTQNSANINLGSPIQIGNVTPNAGQFTSLLVSGVAVALSNDARFSDARNPLEHTQAISTVTGLQAALDTKADGTDSRLSNTRTPTDSTVTDIKVAANAEIAWSKISKTSATIADLGLANTDGLSEGSTNLYFTAARARSAFTAGTNISITNGVISSSGGPGGTVDLSSPPPIGNTTPNTGSFTTLAASGSISVGATSVALTNDARLTDARVPLAHNQAWSTITSTPTTLSGYGITNAVGNSDSRLSDARTPLAHNQAWSTITGLPTTLAGYGITDAINTADSRLSDARVPLAHNQAWSTITGTPTTVAGYGITDAQPTGETSDLFFEIKDHYLSGSIVASSPIGSLGLIPVISGTGSAVGTAVGTAANPGVVSLTLGTTTAGHTIFRTNVNGIVFGTALYKLKAVIKLSNLSDGTESYNYRAGFGDTGNGVGAIVDGAFFSYNQANANWICNVVSNSVAATPVTTSVAATTAFTTLEIIVNKAATSVTFFINGVLVATITTNIPTGTGRETGIIFAHNKTLGITARDQQLDFTKLIIDYR